MKVLMSYHPEVVVTGDFNNDVKTDRRQRRARGGSVPFGNGDGTFGTHIDSPSGGMQTSSIATGNINADGKLDLVVAHPPDGIVSILLGNGDQFQAAA